MRPGGLERGEVELHRVGEVQSTPGSRPRSARAPDAADRRARSRAASRPAAPAAVSAPSPPPTSSTTSPGSGRPRGRSRRAGWDRRGSSGPAAPLAHQPKARAAFASTIASSCDRRAPELGELLGDGDHVCRLVRPPASGLRGEERGVGLDQQQVLGDRGGGLAQRGRARVGEVAGERAVPVRLPASTACSGAEKQCRITVTPSASSRGGEGLGQRLPVGRPAPPSRTWITSGFASRRAISIWARKARRWSSRVGRGRGSSRARSRRPRLPGDGRRAARAAPRRRRRRRRRRSDGG